MFNGVNQHNDECLSAVKNVALKQFCLSFVRSSKTGMDSRFHTLRVPDSLARILDSSQWIPGSKNGRDSRFKLEAGFEKVLDSKSKHFVHSGI